MAYDNLLIEKRGKVGWITLHRPQALNALNQALMSDLCTAIADFDRDDRVGCMVLTGSEKAFAAGADIKEMQSYDMVHAFMADIFSQWEGVARARKPIIAAVAGYALGGGCELAMMCDFILAADNAKFGQPEISLGVLPGGGGTQRLPRFVGKAKAMEMCLTGRMMEAAEAERCGLVSRVLPLDELLEETQRVAERIAEFSLPSVMMVKESVKRAYEMTLAEGLNYERRLFQSTFATVDQKEGMTAFVEKRMPQFRNK